jgi:hypothetical protein
MKLGTLPQTVDTLARRCFSRTVLLDGPPWITVSRTGRLTNSPARTDVTRFIQRVVRPARSPGDFGLNRFATAFMNNPG